MFVQRLLARHFPLRLSLFYFFLLLLIEKISNSFLIMSRDEFVEWIFKEEELLCYFVSTYFKCYVGEDERRAILKSWDS